MRGIASLLAVVLVVVCGGARAARGQPLEGRVAEQVRALIEDKAARTPRQRKIDSRLLYAVKQRRDARIAPGVPTLRVEVVADASGRTLVDITATVTPALLAAIAARGGAVVNSFPRFDAVRAWLPLAELEAVADLAAVRAIQPADQPIFEKLTTSEGDLGHRADQLRTAFGVDGTGVKVGVISDSVDNLAAVQASGDVGAVTVLPGQSGIGTCGGPCLGEGTALLEIVSDLAPGASLYFATASGGLAALATNILALRAAGCDVIVDDVGFATAPVFQDGVAAQAVNTVTADGALYFSSAGNAGNKNDGTSGVWEGDFLDSGSTLVIDNVLVGSVHDFGGATIANAITGDSGLFTLQWSDPSGAAANDYDLYLFDPTLTVLLAASTNAQSGTQNPFELIFSLNTNDVGNRLMIVKHSGEGRYLHLDLHRGWLAVSTAGQIYGHPAAADAFAVASVTAQGLATPFVGGVGSPVQVYSSDGPRRVFYLANGTAITPENFSSTGGTVRPKPDLAAADCVMTSAPGPFNPFCGTSAAAPHAAAIAALLKSAAPGLTAAQIRTALTSTALDIEALGVDRDSGSGLIDAYAALDSVADPTPSATPTVTPTASTTPTPSATATSTTTSTPTATTTASPTLSPTITNTPDSTVADDIDGDGQTDGLTDGVLKLRWMFGFRGPTLIVGAVDAESCTRCTAEAIEAYLASIVGLLDMDDDGEIEPLTDGLLNLRWLFGFRGASLIAGAVDTENCMRCTASEIDDYIADLN